MRLFGLVIASAIAALYVFVSAVDAAECRVRWRAQWASDAEGTMWATSGEECNSPIYTGYGKIDSVTIASPPGYGIAYPSGLSGINYKSKPGFVGNDRFVVAIVGDSMSGVPGLTRLTFDVVVSK